MYESLLFATSVVAAGIAAVTGFGIGSLITPVLSVSIGTKIAIAVVSVPHLVATAIRFWMLRSHVDKKILLNFGIMSAAGGLMGAYLSTRFATPALSLIFGGILIFAGFMGATGLSEKLAFHGKAAWIAGAISGVLGGLVGNQGGIRSAALIGAKISKESFVATATATGLIVDASRMPIYFWGNFSGIAESGKWILITVLGVVTGTILGTNLLKRLPERIFRKAVSLLILFLGFFMLYQGIRA